MRKDKKTKREEEEWLAERRKNKRDEVTGQSIHASEDENI